MSTSRFLSPVALILFASLWVQTLSAREGVLEINQTCALNGGCFAGDTAGFPVTINGSAGNNYKLTGALDLTAHPTLVGIEISESFVTLDMAGFEIAGPTVCTGTPTFDFQCSLTHAGAYGISLIGSIQGVTIVDGIVRGMAGGGIFGDAADLVRIDGLTVVSNSGFGIRLNDQAQVANTRMQLNREDGLRADVRALVRHSFAILNEQSGINVDDLSVVESCVSSENGARAYSLGPRSKFRNNTGNSSFELLQNRCGGGICTERKRYYLTETEHNGNEALSACALGFHMAALNEIHDMSGWQYDYVLGLTLLDSGFGAPNSNIKGWIRTGFLSTNITNCSAWTSDLSEDSGFTAGLHQPANWGSASLHMSPWDFVVRTCSNPHYVWCAED